MSDKRKEELLNHSLYGTEAANLTQEEIDKKWHYCPDWDYLFITPECKEFECCTCFSKES